MNDLNNIAAYIKTIAADERRIANTEAVEHAKRETEKHYTANREVFVGSLLVLVGGLPDSDVEVVVANIARVGETECCEVFVGDIHLRQWVDQWHRAKVGASVELPACERCGDKRYTTTLTTWSDLLDALSSGSPPHWHECWEDVNQWADTPEKARRLAIKQERASAELSPESRLAELIREIAHPHSY